MERIGYWKMSYIIKYAIKAKKDLREIKDYISKDSVNAAITVLNYLYDCIDDLKTTPSIGKYGRVVNTKELIIDKYPYIVSYKLKGGVVYILRVYHTSRKWGED